MPDGEIPAGWHETGDFERALRIRKALARTGGHCPCIPHDTWSEDTLCPCLSFRSGEGCHCGLYEEGRQ